MNIKISPFIKPIMPVAGFNPKITMAVLVCLFLSGCASFSDGPIRHHKIKLTEKSLSTLTGTYQLFPDSIYDKKGEIRLRAYTPKDDRFHQFLSKKKISFDTLRNSSVDVEVLQSNRVSFIFKEDGIIKDTVSLSFRLQSRGLLILGNKYVKFEGIPYILGGSRSEKTRIGLARDGGLILNHAVDNSGALLLMIGAGYSYNSSYHFKKIK